jgi:phytoene dehydrogenase-like protein
MARHDVIVIGAGLAGLAAALHLQRRGLDVCLLEKDVRPGGRVQTDAVDGFLLDRGFQVLLTAYPECRRMLDYRALRLRNFEPGAIIQTARGPARIADPWRRPGLALETVFSPVGTLMDKIRIAGLRRAASRGSLAQLFRRPESTTLRRLQDHGFSPRFISAFLRPFLGGIFLGRDLSTSSRMMEFVFRMMAQGDTALPERGMGEIPAQLAAGLRPGTLRLGATVAGIKPGRVELAGGEQMEARAIVLAVDATAAAALAPRAITAPAWRGVDCLYFAAPRSPVAGPWLVLDGEGRGPINNLHVATEVSPALGPPDEALVSATVIDGGRLDPRQLERAVRRQLGRWFGPSAERWRHLRSYRIAHAQPDQPPGFLEARRRAPRLAAGLYHAGDFIETASLHGALVSGRRAATAVWRDLAHN